MEAISQLVLYVYVWKPNHFSNQVIGDFRLCAPFELVLSNIYIHTYRTTWWSRRVDTGGLRRDGRLTAAQWSWFEQIFARVVACRWLEKNISKKILSIKRTVDGELGMCKLVKSGNEPDWAPCGVNWGGRSRRSEDWREGDVWKLAVERTTLVVLGQNFDKAFWRGFCWLESLDSR